MIRKRGRHYHYEFMLARRRYFGTLDGRDGQPVPKSKAEAREIEGAIRRNIREGKQQLEKQTFAEFFDNTYLPYSKTHKRSWKHDEFRGEVLKEHFGQRTFPEITPMLIVQFVNIRLKSKTKRGTTRSPVTIHKELRLASSVFVMAIGEGVATSNPCTAIPKNVKKKLPARNKRDRYLDDDEEARLFEALRGRRSHLFPLVRFALETGLRRGELFRLAVEHVNLSEIIKVAEIEGQYVDVRPGELLVTRGKNGKPRTVPLSARARAIALAQISDETTGRYLFTSTRNKGEMIAEVKTGFTAACKEAKIRNFRFHDLRHTFATRLNAAGVDPFCIRDLLGHSTTTMSSDYTHTTVAGRHSAIKKLDQRTITLVPNYGRITAKG